MDRRAREAWSAARPGPEHQDRAVCVAPWVSLELDPTGWVYGCCANQLYPLGRIGEDRLRDLWGGPRSLVLREALERWDLSVGCGSCQWHLEHGRMDPDAAVYDRYPVAGDAPASPVAMTFALSNRCNLGCTMCTPELSSTLRRKAGLPAIPSPYDDAFFEDLAGFLPGLRYAKFLGGEPFLIPEHHRVWDLMAKVGGPPRMQVTTNGTIWNDRVAWLLDTFAVDVTISIDAATAPTYEAIRVGASFAVVRANVERFAARCAAAGTELRFCYCLMEQNAHELAGFLHWADGYGAPVSVNVVSDLGMALHDLPADRLEAVLRGWEGDRLGATLTTNAGVWRTQVVQLEEVLAERRAGTPPPVRQAQVVQPGLLAVPSGPPPADAGGGAGSAAEAVVEVERGRLARWSEGGPVADVRGRVDGTICEVRAIHGRLGLTDALVGSRLDDLLGLVQRVDGRPAWALGADTGPGGSLVRTVVLSERRPVRGAAGSIVRFVAVPTADGFALLVAEDRVYDRTDGVAVAAPLLKR